MAELPQGDVTEVRRGDRDALRILSADMARLNTTGYIRTERKPKEKMPRIGHILFIEGHPLLALHEAEAMTFGLEALLEIESDAMPLETLLAVHELPAADAARISSLHSNAYLHLETSNERETNDERWWSNVTLRKGSWRREERLPELEVTVEAPEAIRQRSQAYMQRHEGLEQMIHPGDALMLDALNPSSLFTLVGHLATHGRPVLVISRHDVDSLSVEHGIPPSACLWLSTSEHPRAIEPTLHQVRTKIDGFLWENMRAVVLIEGIEYLAGMNGDGPTIDFLRDVVDGVRMDDHVLLATGDMNAFELEPRHRLARCFSPLAPLDIEQWLVDPELLLDHPLCAPPTDEERSWIEQQLKRAVEHSPVESPMKPDIMVGGHEPATPEERLEATQELDAQVRQWSEANEEPEEDQTIALPVKVAEPAPLPKQAPPLTTEPEELRPQNEQVAEVEMVALPPTKTPAKVEKPPLPKGPRKAHRIPRKRKQASSRPVHPQRGLQAAAQHAPAGTPGFPTSEASAPPTAIAMSLEAYATKQQAALDKTFHSKAEANHEWRDAAQQQSATRHHLLPQMEVSPSAISAVSQRQPHNTSTTLTPLVARPGVEAEAQPKHLPREIASREQTAPSIEDSLTSWELEDLERLRQEREGEQ